MKILIGSIISVAMAAIFMWGCVDGPDTGPAKEIDVFYKFDGMFWERTRGKTIRIDDVEPEVELVFRSNGFNEVSVMPGMPKCSITLIDSVYYKSTGEIMQPTEVEYAGDIERRYYYQRVLLNMGSEKKVEVRIRQWDANGFNPNIFYVERK